MKVDFFGNDKEFTSEEEADKFLEKQYEKNLLSPDSRELISYYE